MTTEDRRPRIAVTYFADRGNPLKLRLFDRVRTWADLVLLDPGRTHPNLAEMGLDLYHMARWSPEAFADFETAHDAGISTINSYEGARTTEDRLASLRGCADHGVPVADFEYGTADTITLDPPVLIKPRHETAADGHDFDLVFSGDVSFEGERLVQRYVVPNRSFKLFRVGEHLRATEERYPHGRPEASRVSGRFVELADAVADLFDLRLFELDVLVHKSHYVIDVNPVVSLEAVHDGLDLYENLLRSACRDATD